MHGEVGSKTPMVDSERRAVLYLHLQLYGGWFYVERTPLPSLGDVDSVAVLFCRSLATTVGTPTPCPSIHST